jgi:CRISPR/Cas system-associated protein Cas5 (RAMP superfamily)
VISLTSEKPIAQKLFIKENYSVLLVNEPQGYKARLGKLPKNAVFVIEPSEPVDFVQLFVLSKKELETQLPKLKSLAKREGLLWVTYPKGTSKIKSDVDRDVIREYAESVGLKAVALVAIDDTWSALRLKIVR